MEESRHKISEQISRKDRYFCGRTGALLRDLFYLQRDKVWYQDIEKIRKRLYWIKEEEGIIFVHGCGKRQSKLQKDIKELENYLAKYKEYNQKIHTCGERSSYSKTDNDATFMRMKEDHLGTGQLEKHQKMAKKKTYEYG